LRQIIFTNGFAYYETKEEMYVFAIKFVISFINWLWVFILSAKNGNNSFLNVLEDLITEYDLVLK